MSDWSDNADAQWETAKALLDRIVDDAAKVYVILEDQNYHTPNEVTEAIAEAAGRLRKYMDLGWSDDTNGNGERDALRMEQELWKNGADFGKKVEQLHEEGYLDK